MHSVYVPTHTISHVATTKAKNIVTFKLISRVDLLLDSGYYFTLPTKAHIEVS